MPQKEDCASERHCHLRGRGETLRDQALAKAGLFALNLLGATVRTGEEELRVLRQKVSRWCVRAPPLVSDCSPAVSREYCPHGV